MTILWIVNIVFPEAQMLLSGKECHLNSSGGWLISSSKKIQEDQSIDLIIASPTNKVKKLTRLEGAQTTYFLLPTKNERKYDKKHEMYWKEIIKEVSPDLVHIHGTEYSHGLAFIKATHFANTVLSIQGICSEIGHHYLDGIPKNNLIFSLTPFDVLFRKDPFSIKKTLEKHAISVEREMIQSCHHVIGRTSFDKNYILGINPDAEYHICNESLRPSFYESTKWSYDGCNQHTIFLSQSSYPLKGLHIVLRALPFVLECFPDTSIRIAGSDITKKGSVKSTLLFSTYANYISHLIAKGNLNNHVKFLGPLDERQMIDEFLKCNVFLCPSSNENSPNSLGEAQLLGVPCIASKVGGIPDMIPNLQTGQMYEFEDYHSLAELIKNTFCESKNWDGEFMQQIALQRHNVELNHQALLSVYREVINGKTHLQ